MWQYENATRARMRSIRISRRNPGRRIKDTSVRSPPSGGWPRWKIPPPASARIPNAVRECSASQQRRSRRIPESIPIHPESERSTSMCFPSGKTPRAAHRQASTRVLNPEAPEKECPGRRSGPLGGYPKVKFDSRLMRENASIKCSSEINTLP